MKSSIVTKKYSKDGKLLTGFTIIELVITIFILSFGVIGIFSAFSIITILTSDSADRLTATYLAQEGMEIIRNIRDQNWLNMDSNCTSDPCFYTWLDNGLGDCPSSGCAVDYKSTATDFSKAGSYLLIDSNGFYNYTGGEPAKFQRKITITKKTDVVIPPDTDEAKDDHIVKVIVEVSWDKKATILNPGLKAGVGNCDPKNCISVEWMLYDWYNYLHQ